MIQDIDVYMIQDIDVYMIQDIDAYMIQRRIYDTRALGEQ